MVKFIKVSLLLDFFTLIEHFKEKSLEKEEKNVVQKKIVK